ncbi:MAG: endonuclease/exonuclease/phosphatase family protein [Burkholderiaceae bacterium]
MLKILSWNIQYGTGVDGRIDLPRIRDHIVALGDPDVICLQEVSAGFDEIDAGADQAARLAELFPGYRMTAPPALEWWDGDRCRRFGNALLTRLPLVERQVHSLPRPADAGTCHMQRQLLEVVVATDLGPLRVCTTHLEYYSRVQREAQIQRLRELEAQWAAARSAPPKALRAGIFGPRPIPVGTVLCGDFNLPVEEPTYAAIQQPLGEGRLVDAWSVVGRGRPHAPTFRVHDGRRRSDGGFACDFFFVSDHLAPRVVALRTDVDTTLSDHQPLLLTLATEDPSR